MKLRPAEIHGFVNSPAPNVHTVLIYGPDNGLVKERSAEMRRRWLPLPDDPFGLCDFNADQLHAEPGRLVEEAQAMSLMGGDRVILMRAATDKAAKAVQQLLAIERPVARTVIEAGDLGPSSKLRKLVEQSRLAAAIACYRDDQAAIVALARQMLKAASLTCAPDVYTYFSSHLGNDRAVTRGEIEKLILFVGPGRRTPVTLDEVEQAIGDSSSIGADQAATAVFLGEPAVLSNAIDRLLAEAQSPVMITRVCLRMAQQLLELRINADAGMPVDEAVNSLRPPIHFRSKPVYRRALGHWSAGRLTAAIELLLDLEVACKSTGLNDQAMLRDGLWRLIGSSGIAAR